MPTNYAGSTASFPANVALPDDGDNADAAALDQPSIDLADRTAYMRSLLHPTVRVDRFRPTSFTAEPGGTTTALVDLASAPNVYPAWPFTGSPSAGSTKYTYTETRGMTFNEVWTSTTFAHAYSMPLTSAHLSNGRTLTTVKLRFGAAGAHAGLPAQKPAIYVGRVDRTSFSNAETALLSTTNGWSIDTSADVTAYQTAHDITFTANQNNVIDLSQYIYTLTFAYEGGSNGLVGGRTGGVEFTHT